MSRNGAKLSAWDRRFNELVSESINRREDGHYETCLPLKHDSIAMPNNRPLAAKRLHMLLRRLSKTTDLRNKFVENMKEMIKSYAEPVPAHEIQLKNGMVNYVPYLVVTSDKNRVNSE